MYPTNNKAVTLTLITAIPSLYPSSRTGIHWPLEKVLGQVSRASNYAAQRVGCCTLVPVAGSNYATGTVMVQGRKLHAKSQVRASVNNRETTTIVKVVQKPPETGIPIRIELRPEDYGNFRARWADHEGKPHLLLVSALLSLKMALISVSPVAWNSRRLPPSLFRRDF